MAAQVRRRGKELRERALAALLLVPLAPVLLGAATAVWLEARFDRSARGPVFFRETRISRGQEIQLIKFRTLNAHALGTLGAGPSHIKLLEQAGELTRVGGLLRQWYLDELPQLWNIVRGDMFLIGTRPYPVEPYLDELTRGITRKRDMPGGLIGPVQSAKGRGGLELDAAYWEAFQSASPMRLLLIDIGIVLRSLRVLLEHKGL